MAYQGLISPPSTADSASSGGYQGIATSTVNPTSGGGYQGVATSPISTPPPAPQPSFLQNVVGGIKTIASDVSSVFTAPKTPQQPITPEGYLGMVNNWGTDIIKGWTDFGNSLVHPEVNNNLSFGVNAGKDIAQSGLSFVNAFFAPITSALTQAATVQGPVGDAAQLVNKLFTAVGQGSADVGEGALNALPISQDTKDALLPTVRSVSALAGQIALGKGGDIAKTKLIDTSTQLFSALKNTPELSTPELTKLPVTSETPTETPVKVNTPETAPTEAPNPAFIPLEAPKQPVAASVAPETTPTDPLTTEALKYKSAEDFVKASVYSPARDSVVRGQIRSEISKMTENRPISSLKENPNNPPIDKSTVNVKAEDIQSGTRPYILVDGNTVIDGHHTLLAYKKAGITDVPVIDKSQLTSIYNKAKETAAAPKETPTTPQITSETVKVPQSQLPVGTGETKVSRLEARVTDNLGKMTPDQIDKVGVATYEKMNKADQIQKATEYVTKNPDEAMAVMKGEKDAPAGLLKESIAVALVNSAEGNPSLALRLASLGATRAGQGISMFTEMAKDSSVKVLDRAMQVKSGGKAETARIQTESRVAKSAIKRSAARLIDYEKILDAITC